MEEEGIRTKRGNAQRGRGFLGRREQRTNKISQHIGSLRVQHLDQRYSFVDAHTEASCWAAQDFTFLHV